MHEDYLLIDFLTQFLLLIAVAAVGAAVFERFKLPAVAGFLVVGALVGPGGFRWVEDPERVRGLAELGVAFLLFEVGLELPLERLRRLWRSAVVGGGLQVLLTILLVAVIINLFGMGWRIGLVLGGLLAMSSTALVMRLLADRGEIDAPQGQLAVGILLFQDLCIVPMLLLTPVLAAEDPGSAREAGLALGRSLLALAGFFVVARFLLPPLLERAARAGSRDLFSLLSFVIVLGSAVAAEYIGLTLAVGAFLGGLVVSASPYAHQLFAEVLPLRGVLLGIFFTAVGMLFEPLAALQSWPAVVAYVSAVVVLKAAVVAVIVVYALGQSLRLGLISGLSLAQTGEFSFVLAAAAASQGLLSESLEQIFIAGSVVTLLATPFLMSWAPRFATFLTGSVDRRVSDREPGVSALHDHVVLVGFGLANRQLARVLQAIDVRYLAVESNAVSVREAIAHEEPVIYGDATRIPILQRLGVTRARLVVVAISDAVATLRAVQLIRRLTPDVRLLVRTRFVSDVDQLAEAGASEVLVEEFESTLGLLSQTLSAAGVREASVSNFLEVLREEGYEPMRMTGLKLDPWLAELLERDEDN